jgi:hypothetical protein
MTRLAQAALVAVAVGVSVALAVGQTRREEHAKSPDAAPAVIMPVLTLDAAGDMALRVAMENTSDQPIRYRPWYWKDSVRFMELHLRKGGRLIPNQAERVWAETLPPRELKPGESLPLVWNLREWYDKLEPGRYEARITYLMPERSVEVTRDGLSPMHLEQRFYIEVK